MRNTFIKKYVFHLDFYNVLVLEIHLTPHVPTTYQHCSLFCWMFQIHLHQFLQAQKMNKCKLTDTNNFKSV